MISGRDPDRVPLQLTEPVPKLCPLKFPRAGTYRTVDPKPANSGKPARIGRIPQSAALPCEKLRAFKDVFDRQIKPWRAW